MMAFKTGSCVKSRKKEFERVKEYYCSFVCELKLELLLLSCVCVCELLQFEFKFEREKDREGELIQFLLFKRFWKKQKLISKINLAFHKVSEMATSICFHHDKLFCHLFSFQNFLAGDQEKL